MMTSDSANVPLIFEQLERVPKNYESELIIREKATFISESGQEVDIDFIVYSDKDNESTAKFNDKRRSCFELLKRIAESSKQTTTLTPDSLVAFLAGNPRLVKELQEGGSSNPEGSDSLDTRELIVSTDMETFYRLPTVDFALAKLRDELHVCTALQLHAAMDRLFFRIKNFSAEFEQVLRGFMVKPSITPSPAPDYAFPVLPSLDTESLLVRPAGVFESFMDIDQDDGNENENEKSMDNELAGNGPQKTSPSRAPTKRAESSQWRQCLNCFCTTTPMWRRGPDGTASLCNACGVKFKAGKLQMDSVLVERNLKKIRQNQQAQQQEQTHSQEQFTLHQY